MLIVICFLLLVFCTYFFIPSTLKISKIIKISSTSEVSLRFLSSDTFIQKWMTSTRGQHSTDGKYTFKNTGFKLEQVKLDYVLFKLTHAGFELPSYITINDVGIDSAEIVWQTTYKTSLNPFKRVREYIDARSLHADLGDVLQVFKTYVEDDFKVYNLKIRKEKVTDSILITTKFVSDNYPTMVTVYQKINLLRISAAKNACLQTDSPMLNIVKNPAGKFEIQTAVPVDKTYLTTADQPLKRMVLGNILVTDVKGGRSKIENAFKQIGYYLNDKHLVSPAIPYESLIVNRLEEPDSSKWITRIYYPIY